MLKTNNNSKRTSFLSYLSFVIKFQTSCFPRITADKKQIKNRLIFKVSFTNKSKIASILYKFCLKNVPRRTKRNFTTTIANR